MAIFFLRHTRTAEAEGICYGALDVALADSFDHEFSVLQPTLPTVDVIYTSPLVRCTYLANRIGERQNLTPIIDDRLVEMDFGNWQGKSWDEIPREEIDAWAENVTTYRGHGGENVLQLRDRVNNFLSSIDHSLDTLVVGHAGVIRSAVAERDQIDETAISVAYGKLIQLH
jgi:alpha-ribazole phosphatase